MPYCWRTGVHVLQGRKAWSFSSMAEDTNSRLHLRGIVRIHRSVMIAPVLRETWKQWCKLQIYNCALLRQESICLLFTLSFVSSLHEQLKACLWLSMLARPLNVGQSYNGNTAEWWRTRVRAEVVDSFVWHRLHGERRYGCAMFTDNSVAFAFEEYMSYAGVAMRN